jgi:ribosomal protein S18 acetylase RimI-like enzyme
VIEFRPFRNDDPPRLADVWRSAPLGPAALQPMTTAWLDAAVFAKPFFDREGLVVAVDQQRVVGFGHAAFGPNADGSGLDTTVGSTVMLAVLPHPEEAVIGSELLDRCETYLENRGATTLLGGGSPSCNGFYLGLYGGADLPGVLDSSPAVKEIFQLAGYEPFDRVAVLRRPLEGYRPPIDRSHLAIRRTTKLCSIDEPARRTWWEAAVTCGIGLRRYELRAHGGGVLATASFWDMQPLAAAWGVVAAGLLHVGTQGPRRREGLAHYLLAEAMQDLAREGVEVVESHASLENLAAMRLLDKLGFEACEMGTVFRKPRPEAE